MPSEVQNLPFAAVATTTALTKRQFMVATAGALASLHADAVVQTVMPSYAQRVDLVQAPVLPFGVDALAPYISAETLSYHHGQHHLGYYKALATQLGDQAGALRLPELIQRLAAQQRSAPSAASASQYNLAAQLWNHNFFWAGLRPGAGGPTGPLLEAINRGFGSPQKLLEKVRSEAVGLFGSGWVWIAAKDGQVSVVSTSNADTPLTLGLTPLWVIDVWEHAYYVDQRNKRAAYVDALLQNLVNWDFMALNYPG
jgi:Fe-Mn family superoxide dismutase